jgi:ParB family chromosome partitioning protein
VGTFALEMGQKAACSKKLSLTQIRERIKAARTVKEEPQSLKNQIKEASGRLQKARFWDNPKKQKQLEKLLAQM